MRAGHLLIAILLAAAMILVARPLLSRRAAPPLTYRDVAPPRPTEPAPPAPSPISPAPIAAREPPAPQPPSATEGRPTLTIPRSTFAPGERIRVTFATPSYPDDAWIGVIPSETPHGDEAVNDRADVAYQHLNGRTSGEMVFVAPRTGQWDLRLHTSDAAGTETASVSFIVCEGSDCARFPYGPAVAPREVAVPPEDAVTRTVDGVSYAGVWRSGEGRDCRLQQDGREAWWLCVPRRGEASWRIGHGPITANAITLRVAEIPLDPRALPSGDGRAAGTALRGETLVLTVVGPDELRSVQGTGPTAALLSWRRTKPRTR